MKPGWMVAFGVLCGLLAAGILFLASQPVRGEPIQLMPLPTPAPILVYVTGEVLAPDVYALPAQSRVGDAVEAAGGFTELADEAAVNLAARLSDGQKVLVPARAEVVLGTGSRAEPLDLSAGAPIDINSASQAELESLPGIGPVIAQAILAYRNDNGPFNDVAELENVPGIGPGILAKIQDLVTVNP
jgi:competence protein ComEA